MRLFVDYRDVNAQTVKDAFPLPLIDQDWPLLSKAKCFASLDLLIEYHQVVMDMKDRAKTAFLTHRGLFVYNVMPIGLSNTPATFERLLEKVLGSLVGNGALVYFDDILTTELPKSRFWGSFQRCSSDWPPRDSSVIRQSIHCSLIKSVILATSHHRLESMPTPVNLNKFGNGLSRRKAEDWLRS